MSRPRLSTEFDPARGVAALALLAVMVAVFLSAAIPEGGSFPDGASITAGIGYAMFGLTDQTEIAAEPFLVAFEIIDVVLVAALVGAVMLARREDEGVLAQIRRARREGGDD